MVYNSYCHSVIKFLWRSVFLISLETNLLFFISITFPNAKGNKISMKKGVHSQFTAHKCKINSFL